MNPIRRERVTISSRERTDQNDSVENSGVQAISECRSDFHSCPTAWSSLVKHTRSRRNTRKIALESRRRLLPFRVFRGNKK